MKKKFTLPHVPKEQQTPQVKSLLNLIEELIVHSQQQSEEIAILKDEINILKGEKKRPKFKPSRLDKKTDLDKPQKEAEDQADEDKPTSPPKRPGSNKRHKTPDLIIHHTQVIEPDIEIPEGSTRNGYRYVTIQDLVIESQNTCYKLACWRTPEGQSIAAQLPDHLRESRFGPTLQSYLLYQHYHCHVTQPLLHEQLTEYGVSISTGQINRILSDNKEKFHTESDAILKAALTGYGYIGVDDTGGRHQGKNGVVTCISNDCFAWFKSTDSKSRINFLNLLGLFGEYGHLNDAAFTYLELQGFPKKLMALVELYRDECFDEAGKWLGFLCSIGLIEKNQIGHIRTLTEAILMGALYDQEICQNLIIISDGAGQFNILLHALCWVHTERLIHKMVPLNDQHRQEIAMIRGQIWDLYRSLKHYKQNPNEEDKIKIEKVFDDIFEQKTSYELLNQQLSRIRRNKSQLLLVLEHPHIPLNTNFVEGDIREWVKKRKISGGTRSQNGQRCRDTFASLKKTCRKLGISFWDYLLDRAGIGQKTIPFLNELVAEKMVLPTGY